MIKFIQNSVIDRAAWDECINSYPVPHPYAYSWYLDIISPGWCALVDHDYTSVFPLPSRQRLGIKYIFTPPFLQSLGLFSMEEIGIGKTGEYLSFIPVEYRFIDLCMVNNPGIYNAGVSERDNYRLVLDDNYESISSGYSSDCRRNISKAVKEIRVLTDETNPREVIDLFLDGPGKKVRGIKERDYLRLEQLMNYAIETGQGEIISVKIKKRLVHAIFLLKTRGSVTLLFTATSEESRSRRCGYRVVDCLIRKYAESETVIDFAGSSIPSIADFIKSFGATRESYYRVYRNNLPWPVSSFR